MKMDQTECSETLAFKLQTPLNHPEESIQKYSDFHCPESKFVSAECDTVLTDTFLLTYNFLK
jgi:hypothetical protein